MSSGPWATSVRQELIDSLLGSLKLGAMCSAVFLYLSPMGDIREAQRTKTVGEMIFLPFVCMWANASLWAQYGFYTNDMFPMFFTNAVGFVCSSYYCGSYVTLLNGSRPRAAALNQLAFALLVVISTVAYSFFGDAPEEQVRYWAGLVAACSSVLQYASPLAGLIKVIRRRSTEGMSGLLTGAALVCSVLWTSYGALNGDSSVYLPNLLGVFFSVAQLVLFILYPSGGPPRGVGHSPPSSAIGMDDNLNATGGDVDHTDWHGMVPRHKTKRKPGSYDEESNNRGYQ